MKEILTALIGCLCFSTIASAQQLPLVWQHQAGMVACQDLTRLQIQAESITPTGIHRPTAGCWFINLEEDAARIWLTQKTTVDDDKVSVLYHRAYSLTAKQTVFVIVSVTRNEYDT
tara:strand:+ start:3542 stop:3889 length:348 start_codon:yes stop_codon:yes gene_type:complete